MITTKWPWWLPAGIIALVLSGFAWLEFRRKETGAEGTGAYLIVAIGAGALTYFTQ